MNGSIDTRVVQLEFDNRDFERNVQTSLKTIDKLNDSLQFSGVEKGAANLSNALGGGGGIAGAISKVQLSFSALEIAGKRVIERLVDEAISGAARITKSLTTDLIGTGFNKKGEKDKSEATILAAVKNKYSSEEEAIEHVTGSVEKLAWFTDETSYNMNEMISNIGKFTSAGADLDGATKAMMGMATATALAGQNSEAANRVMYNMAQAYGSGKVQLMDWKSVENANVATESLKNTLIETAAAEGKLKKKQRKAKDENGKSYKDENGKWVMEDYYVTKKGNKEVNSSNFNSTLQMGWLTADVMEKGFGKYAEFADAMYAAMDSVDQTATEMLQTIEAGTAEKATAEDVRKAQELLDTLNEAAGLSGENALTLDNIDDNIGLVSFKAAQEARTFQDAKDAINDVMSSGWMEVFDAMLGDFKESSELWTTFANEVSGFLYEIPGSIAEIIRIANSFTLPVGEDMEQMTAAEAVISGISDAWETFKTIVEAVKQAYADVFGEGGGIRLARAAKSFKEFTESMKPSEETLVKLKNALGGVFSVLEIGVSVVKFFAKLAFGTFKKSFGFVLNFASGIGKLFKNTHNSLKQSGAYEKIQKKLEDRFKSIGGVFTKLSGKFKKSKLFVSISKQWSKFTAKMSRVTSIGEAFKLTGDLIKGVLNTIGSAIRNFFSDFLKKHPKLKEFMDKASEKITAIKTNLTDIYNKTLGKLVKKVKNWVKGFIDAKDKIQYLKDTWAKVKDKFSKGVDKIKAKFKEWADIFKKGGLSALFKKLGEDFVALKDKVVAWFKDIFGISDEETEEGTESLGDKIKSKFEEIKASIEKWVESVKAKLKNWFKGLWAAITGKNENGEEDDRSLLQRLSSFFNLEKLKEKFDEVKKKITDWINNLFYGEDAGKTDEETGLVNDISARIDDIKARIIESITNAWEEVKTFVSNLWNSLFGKDSEELTEEGGSDEDTVFSKWSDGIVDSLNAGAKKISEWFRNIKTKIFGEEEEKATDEAGTSISDKLNSIKENLSKTLTNLKGNLIKWAIIIGVVALLFVAIKTTAGILNRKTDEIKTQKMEAQANKFKEFGNMMLKVAGAVVIILTAIYLINKLGITPGQFAYGMGLIIIVIGAIAGLSILTNYLNNKIAGGSSLNSFGTTCLGIAASLLILAAAIVIFTKIFTVIGKKSPGALALAIIVVGLLTVVMGLALGLAGKGNGKDSKTFAMLLACIGLAILLRRVTRSIVELSSVDPSVLWKSAVVVAALMVGLGLMIDWCIKLSKKIEKFKGFLKLAVVIAGMYALTLIIGKISQALVSLSGMSAEQIENGGKALVILLAAIAVVLNESIKMSNNIDSFKDFVKLAVIIGGIYVLALACIKVADAISKLTAMTPGQMIAGGVVLAAVIAALGAVIVLLPRLVKNRVDVLVGAVLCGEMLVLAEAANILAPALISLSSCNIAGLATGGLVLAAIFVAMGYAMSVAGKNIEAGVSNDSFSAYAAYKSSAEEFKSLADAAAILAPSLISLSGYDPVAIGVAGGVIAAVLAAMGAALLLEGKDLEVGMSSDTTTAYATYSSSADAFLGLATAVTTIAPALIALAGYDEVSIAVAGGVMAAVLAAMGAALLIEGKDISAGVDSDTASAYVTYSSSADAFLGLATAVTTIAPALIALAGYDEASIATAGGVISAVLLAMGAALMLEGKDGSVTADFGDVSVAASFTTNSKAFVDLANACSTIATSLLPLVTGASSEDIAVAGGVLSAVLLAISGAILASKDITVGEDGGLLSISTNSDAISSALMSVATLVDPLKILSGIQEADLKNAKTAITDILNAIGTIFGDSSDVSVGWGLFKKEANSGDAVDAISSISTTFNTYLVPILPSLENANGSMIKTNLTSIGEGMHSLMSKVTSENKKVRALEATSSILSDLTKNVDTSKLGSLSELIALIGNDETNIALGSDFVAKIAQGVESNAAKLSHAITNMCIESRSTARSYYTQFNTAGGYVIQGFVSGIKGAKQSVIDAIKGVCKEAAITAKISLEIQSPSKVFAGIGKFVDLGLAKGIDDNAAAVKDSVNTLCSTATSLAYALTSEIDDDLTITPVVDLSNVRKSSDEINSLLGYKKALGVSSSLKASTVASQMNANEEIQNGLSGGNSQTYSFVQNNYSPKALSQSDIYRQTKNQFSMLKGLIKT